MDTNRIKRFATEARTRLKEGIAAKIITLGFDKKGNVKDELKPQLIQGGTLWNGQLLPESFYHQWMSLYRRVQQKGINEAYEEAAYTWFNRLCAIRVLQKNNLCAPALDYADSARTPLIVDEARQGRLPQMTEEARARLMELLDDDTKVTEQFAALITAWCHDNPIINSCFGQMADYTELLLPNNILAENGFVDMLNHTDYITDADYRSPELIGWLYQFYISERKDEVFAKKGKLEADEIPAATQIFTPNWIVKYMVQNTVGRIYLDNNPYERQLQRRWQYLVEPPEKTASEDVLHYDELTDLRVADLACGSGHILNECFDLLYDLYIAEGYGRGEAIENIFRHNLTGIDIDLRAKQLAAFALLLKACQKDKSFVDGHCMPRVWAMPAVSRHAWRDLSGRFCRALGLRADSVINEELDAAFALMEDADSLGSIMKFDISPRTREFLLEAAGEQAKQRKLADSFKPLTEGFEVILALTEQYAALAMNPPYMGGGNMNDVLSRYVKENYEDGKADLATVFVEMMGQRTLAQGRYAFIIPPSWMFLSAFENLRKSIIDNQVIDSLLHLSRGVFGADFGASSAVISNTKNPNACGIYFRLIERTFQEFDQKHLRMLFEKTLANHDFRFLFGEYSKEVEDIVYSEKGAKIYYPDVRQDSFEKIPGCPIGYWVSEKMIEIFAINRIKDSAKPIAGICTGANDDFLRFWHEVNPLKIGKNQTEYQEALSQDKYSWYIHYKGGSYRRWYGNREYILHYSPTVLKEMENNKGFRHDGKAKYFHQGITWSKISSGLFSARYMPTGCTFDSTGTSVFPKKNEIYPILGFLNSSIIQPIVSIVNPTMAIYPHDIADLPYLKDEVNDCPAITSLVQENITISKQDWDAHETSWDFRRNELFGFDAGSIEERVEQYKRKWETLFFRLHDNEEELNRLFIDIYGLQDELSPDVPLSEITILQAGEITIEEE